MSRASRSSASKRRKKVRIMARDGCACHYCRADLTPRAATLEHVVPAVAGGTWADANLVLACLTCNQSMRQLVDKCACRFCQTALAMAPDRLALRRALARDAEIRAAMATTE